MSSSFSSALAELDGSIQTLQSQLDRLRAALEVDDDQLSRSLTNARQRGAMVRDLIHAERPDADWKDRRALDQMIHELEFAKAKRDQEKRRTKLLDLANELKAGGVRHRFAPRTAALENLRLEAVKELETEAALSDQVRDLPGPNASAWLHWACGLQDATDALVLTTLCRDFPTLERFTAEIEESYWIPGQPVYESARQPSGPSVQTAEAPAAEALASAASKPVASVGTDEDEPPGNVSAQLDSATQSANDAEAPVRRRYVGAWVAAASIVVLGAILAGIHHFHATTNSKPDETVAAPGATVNGVAQDSDATPLLNRQPAEGAQRQILLNIELCKRADPESIECWGYASNLGGQSSQVSLRGVDVVDGKGNAFSLKSNGQFDFSTGNSSNIPAGSRAKYTVKIPDKDREARTLTLYLDLSNPPGLEYTFRDVPVAE